MWEYGFSKPPTFIIKMETEDKRDFKALAMDLISSDMHNKKTAVVELCKFIDNFDRGK